MSPWWQITSPLRVAHQFHCVAQQVDEILRERSEHRDAAQMIFQRAFAVVGVQLRFECFVALDDVEHVAQHLEHDAIGCGADRGGARIQAHARHFAEQIAGVERRDGIVVGQIHGSVDGNGAARSFFFAALLLASQPTGWSVC